MTVCFEGREVRGVEQVVRSDPAAAIRAVAAVAAVSGRRAAVAAARHQRAAHGHVCVECVAGARMHVVPRAASWPTDVMADDFLQWRRGGARWLGGGGRRSEAVGGGWEAAGGSGRRWEAGGGER